MPKPEARLPTAVWLTALAAGQCSTCGKEIDAGGRIFPQEDESGQLIYVHLRCAEEAAMAAGLPCPQAPLCRDWVSQGCCPFRDTCILQHLPPAAAPTSPGQLTGRGPVQGDAARAQVAVRRRGKVLKRFRAGAFRRWLLDTFGREALSNGAGVLDVAGGKGELAFELLNLNGIPATVLEPRPLDVRQRAEWLTGGFYGWRGGPVSPLDRPWPCTSEHQQQKQQYRADSEGQRQQQAVSNACGVQMVTDATADLQIDTSSSLLVPRQLRVVVTPELAACIAVGLAAAAGRGPAGSGSSSSGGGSGTSSTSSTSSDGASNSAEHAAPEGWPAVFALARQEARRERWARPSSGHGPEEADAGSRPPQDVQAESVEASSSAAAAGGGSNGGRQTVAGGGAGLLLPEEVLDPEEAWRYLSEPACRGGFSVVVGMHPDEATDFIVDLALATKKPFAVVPCCVHADAFPGRRVAGRPVSSYEDLLEFLVAKDPERIRVATLPVEGRSRVVYRA